MSAKHQGSLQGSREKARRSLPLRDGQHDGPAAGVVALPMRVPAIAKRDVCKGEALRGEPGISVSLNGAQRQNRVIRGLQKDSVLLMVDGMRLNHAIPGFTGAGAMSAQRKL
ncbi:MAG: TonB-dependent receptor plug domain-containing protein [Alicycliphilus sp.]|nr:TonB-dependent receptor plug domain-containing protein [Alicycliphilus sp.]